MSNPRSQVRIRQIREAIRNKPKYTSQIAKELGMKPHLVIYYLNGWKVRGQMMGGYLKGEFKIVKREGRNLYIQLKRSEK